MARHRRQGLSAYVTGVLRRHRATGAATGSGALARLLAARGVAAPAALRPEDGAA